MPVAVTHDQRPKRTAQAQQDESLFVRHVIRIGNEERVLIKEHRLRLLERYSMLPAIRRALPIIPLESEVNHTTV